MPGSSENTIRSDYYTHNYCNGRTHFIGELQPNELGIYDMSGNVYEWCWNYDEFQNEYAKSRIEKIKNLRKMSASDSIYFSNHKYFTYHIICGGSHKSKKIECETNYFMYKSEYDYSSDLGFRVVRNAK